jgi:hypothetical protein
MKNVTSKLLSFVLMGLLASCGTAVVINEEYTKNDPDFKKTFAKTDYKKCENATIQTLKEMGIGIESQGKGNIITNRYEAHRYSSSSGYVSSTGGVSGTAVLKSQQVKAYLNVSKASSGCEVTINRVRAWENNVEFPTLNLEFVKKMFVQPFFTELSERAN